MINNEYKECPFCCEEIKTEVTKCNYCESIINEDGINSASNLESKIEDFSQYSSARLLLLSKFKNGDSPGRYDGLGYWEVALGENPKNAINDLIQEGLLETADLFERIDYCFKVSDLKSLLKEKGLKLTGNKKQLIQRLINSDSKAMIEATKNIDLLRCSSYGAQLIEKYLEAERKKKELVESIVINNLKQKEYSAAVNTVAQYEASQVFPRGMGIDWKDYDGAADVEGLNMIFTLNPAILKSMGDHKIDQIRIATAMMFLWGKNTARQWLSDDFETGIHFDEDTACRMLLFNARHYNSIKSYYEAKQAGVNILSIKVLGTSDSCPACNKISGKKYILDEVPELPYEKCTQEKGCRCTTVVGEMK